MSRSKRRPLPARAASPPETVRGLVQAETAPEATPGCQEGRWVQAGVARDVGKAPGPIAGEPISKGDFVYEAAPGQVVPMIDPQTHWRKSPHQEPVGPAIRSLFFSRDQMTDAALSAIAAEGYDLVSAVAEEQRVGDGWSKGYRTFWQRRGQG